MCKTSESNAQNNNQENADDNVPRLCQFWIRVHESLPFYPLKLFGMDFSMTLAGALFLTSVRILSEFIQIHVFGWPSNSFVTKNAAASVGAITHSLLLVPALWLCFRSVPFEPSASMDKSPIWYQKTADCLLQFCTAYMVYDGLFNVLWLKYTMDQLGTETYVFGGHHLATVLYMTSTRVVEAGHQSAMICMLLGEMTNPFHNSFYVAQAAITLDCCNGTVAHMLYHVVRFLFSLSYFVARAIISPPALAYVTLALWWHRNYHIPAWLLGMWTFLIWAVEIGSIPYIQDSGATTLHYLKLATTGVDDDQYTTLASDEL